MYNIKIIIRKLVLSSIFWKLFLYCFENKNKNTYHIHWVYKFFFSIYLKN